MYTDAAFSAILNIDTQMLTNGSEGGDLKEKAMKLTKGQLKRIIREEYSRLKRQGLIQESNREDYYNSLSITQYLNQDKIIGSKKDAKKIYKYIFKHSHQGTCREMCSEEMLESRFGPDVLDMIKTHPKLDDVHRAGSPDLGYWYEADLDEWK